MDSKTPLMFPKWSNRATVGVVLGIVFVPAYVGLLLAYGAHPTTLYVGYAPEQPVPYSHAQHVGKLGLDCRYCHFTVEKSAVAAIPPTEVCMNCHTAILPNTAKLGEVRRSHVEGTPIRWVKVHDLPDYAYFHHAAHVNAGVGCSECHGPVQQMAVVQTVQPLSMAWCLDCHRNPESRLRPRDQVTNMEWRPPEDSAARAALGRSLRDKYHVNPNTDCATCHR